MSLYRVTLKINFMVDINEENNFADPRPALQGDTSKAAVNRASCVWMKGMSLTADTRKSLGVGQSFSRVADVEVVNVEPTTQTEKL